MPLAICATPIGNLGDVTLRVLDELRAADVILCEDTRRTRILLARHGIEARLESHHRHNEAARTPRVLERLRGGERVALVSDAGLPGVNDPGARLIAAAVAAGVEVTVLPGASAVETALVVSGLGADRYQFVGYLPRRAGELRTLASRARRLEWRSRRLRVAAPPPGIAPRARGGAPGSSRGRVPRAHEALRGGRARVSRGVGRAIREAPRGEITLVLGPTRTSASARVDEDARAAVSDLVASGASRRAAAEVVARLTGTSRNALYRDSL